MIRTCSAPALSRECWIFFPPTGQSASAPKAALEQSGFEAVQQAWQDISDNLDDDNELTIEILEEAAIRGMLNALGDPQHLLPVA